MSIFLSQSNHPVHRIRILCLPRWVVTHRTDQELDPCPRALRAQSCVVRVRACLGGALGVADFRPSRRSPQLRVARGLFLVHLEHFRVAIEFVRDALLEDLLDLTQRLLSPLYLLEHGSLVLESV